MLSYFRPVRRTASHPPLDFTFFQKIDELGVSVPNSLRSYARGLPTGTPFLSDDGSGGRMEEFLRDLFHDFLQQRARSESEPVRAYRALVRLYADVLRTTTNWMGKSTYTGGPVGRLLDVAADAADRVDVITFNHDLVIETRSTSAPVFARGGVSRLAWPVCRRSQIRYGGGAAGVQHA